MTVPTAGGSTAPGGARQSALRCLALDVLAARTVGLLRDRGIDCLLLKGPGLAARLYPEDPSARAYTDVDILVTPADFDAACRVLVAAGYQWKLQGVGADEFPWYEAPLTAPAGLIGSVDLHRGFAGVGRPRELFAALGSEREHLTVAGAVLDVPGPIGTTLLTLLHAASPGRARHPRVDLHRADALMDERTWIAAVRWGRALGADAALAAAIDLLPPARRDRRRAALGENGPAIPAHLWLAGRQQSRVSVNLARVLHERSGPRAIVRQIVRRVFPSPAFVALWDPRATQGPRGLALAYGARLRRTVLGTPGAVRDLLHAHRSGARITPGHRQPSGARSTPGHQQPSGARSTPGHRQPSGARSTPGHQQPNGARSTGTPRWHPPRAADPRRWVAAAWTLGAATVLHRRLRRAPLAQVRVPTPPLTPRTHDRGAIRRALRLGRVPCLPTALIWQEWHGRLGRPRDVLVGVRRDEQGTVRAHAWLDGQDPRGDFTALHRHPWTGAAARDGA